MDMVKDGRGYKIERKSELENKSMGIGAVGYLWLKGFLRLG
jgi:hypothetical protein